MDNTWLGRSLDQQKKVMLAKEASSLFFQILPSEMEDTHSTEHMQEYHYSFHEFPWSYL